MDALKDLRGRIDACMGIDRRRLLATLRRLRQRLRAGEDPRSLDEVLLQLRRRIDESTSRRAARATALPRAGFPEALPICARREEIAAAIQAHQVVIVCGETGSGKSTQLPKICLALGRGVAGMIGHTQPRRIAARTIAMRVAEELGQGVGESVGFKVRFSDSVRPHTHVKVMTDGILLAETQGDRLLDAYDTLIIDEAHERSLNIDFLLGYLKTLLPRRPDLKLIVTSATIDPRRFSRYFDDAPVIEVSGRTWPVETRYRPLGSLDESEQDKDQLEGIVSAVDELSRHGRGDILVFLPGERDIKETAEALRKHHPPDTEVVPLFARQSAREQARVFAPHQRRHIVLATNVAETSLTVPGIRYVIDPGTARISRYSPRTKVQRLPIEKISQASADQRKGRCGRVAEGVCIRLYAEEDYQQRPLFTDAEIRRTSLASVILRLEALGFGHIEDFPFIEPPESRYVNDGYKLLEELGAVDAGRSLTPLGRRLARLPIDPRIARMLLAAAEENCLDEVLIIASALSIQDPRERPLDAPRAADEAHALCADERSDFLGFLNLWRFYEERLKHLSRKQMRKLCRSRFLSHNRMREWRDIHSQLRGMVHDMGLSSNREPAGYEAMHRALLSGLLGNIGCLGERHEYTGARGIRFHVFPGSSQFKARPRWLMAAELAETTRLYARTVAAIQPEWVVRVAGHLVKRNCFEPHWEKRAGRVMAFEKLTLYGLVLIPRQKVHFGRIDPQQARRLFIEAALVRGEMQRPPAFLRHNQALIEELEHLEHRSRRADILVDERRLFDFYDARIPPDINSSRDLARWLRRGADRDKDLRLTREDLLQDMTASVSDSDFPPEWVMDGLKLRLEYHFAPGDAADGVTLNIPLAALNQVSGARLEWLVPGLLEEKMTELIRALPKRLRVNFVPAPEYAAACYRQLSPCERPLTECMAELLGKRKGIGIEPGDWRIERLPPHLLMNLRVRDEQGRVVAEGRNLESLRQDLAGQVQASFSALPSWSLERHGLRDWDFGVLPESVRGQSGGVELDAYPALIDEGDSVSLRVVDTPREARHQTHAGLRRLFMLSLAPQFKRLRRQLPGLDRLCLHYARIGACDELREDILAAVAERAFMHGFESIRDAGAFSTRREAGRAELVDDANDICRILAPVLAAHHRLSGALNGALPPNRLSAAADLREQLEHLVYPGFVTATDPACLKDLPRYLQGAERRLEKLDRDPARDRAKQHELEPHWRPYVERVLALEAEGWLLGDTPELETYRWMLEEYRVQLFAQELGTRRPVSAARLQRQWRRVLQE